MGFVQIVFLTTSFVYMVWISLFKIAITFILFVYALLLERGCAHCVYNLFVIVTCFPGVLYFRNLD